MTLELTDIDAARNEALQERVMLLNATIVDENFLRAQQYMNVKRLIKTIHDLIVTCNIPADLRNTIVDYLGGCDVYISDCIKSGRNLSELTVVSQKEIPTELTQLAMKRFKIEALFDGIMAGFEKINGKP